MRLYLVHCGFYDDQISSGIYEFHVNLAVAAEDLPAAKARIRLNPDFIAKKMHIDGIQEIERIDGHEVRLVPVATGSLRAKVIQHLHRDL